MRIRAKLTLFISCVIVAVSTALGIAASEITEKYLIEQLHMRLHESTTKLTDKISEFLDDGSELIGSLADHHTIKFYFTDSELVDLMQVEDLLHMMGDYFSELVLLDVQGKEIAKVRDGRISLDLANKGGTSLFNEMKKMAEKTSEIYEVVGEKGDDIRYVVKVTNIYEEFAGLISGTLSAEMVQREINSLHSAGVDNIYIVNNSGAFLSHPDSEKVYRRALSVTDYSKLVEISSREVVDSHAIIKMNFDGLDSFIDFNFLHNTKWGVVTAIEQSGFHEKIRRVKEVFLLITIVAIAAGVLLALFVAHSMASPIASLTRVAARISEGDLSTRCAFRSNDEIGSLASSFNRMLEDLQKARNGLEKKIRELVFAQEEQAKLQKELKILQGIIPICASCKNIRDDDGCWNQMESYIGKHSEAEFSHGICPDCEKLLYPDCFD